MTMSSINAPVQTNSLRDIVASIAPRKMRFDPLGLVSGYRAYLVHTRLSAQSDSELAALGLTRAAVPRAAMEAVFEKRAD